MTDGCGGRPRDWAGNWRSLGGLWGIPAAAMLLAVFLDSTLRAVIWSPALAWMGGVCIANARRCGRTHCRFTGPFYLLMAGLVVAYAAGFLPIGEHGWSILGIATLACSALLWWGSERIWGSFWPPRR